MSNYNPPTYNPRESDYDYKVKRSFKSKVKSFFNVDVKKGLQEEEPTKVFEKVKLFTLTRNKLFIGILAFLLLVNILVIFNINQFYLRPILAFIFLITIPGLLIMLCFKIRSIGFWEYLVYTIGLSVAFIMFAGLIVNWTLPFLHITDKPLSLIPILISFDNFLLMMWLYALIRNLDLKPLEIKSPKLDATNHIFFIIPMIFPVLSILGAFLLNNHGPNYLTMIMLGGIALYVFFLVIFRNKLNENVFPWAILMISISLLLSGWLRSWFVSGVDINLEYSIFQLTQEKAIWSLSNFYNTYNAMLSVNILPTILSLFTKIEGSFVIKLFFPLMFMFVPLIVYLISKKYFNEIICFLASFFFMSQQVYINWNAIPTRQEIAFLFFGLMLLVLFSKEINKNIKTILFIMFGFSMIVSHYSTAYIALAIFLFAYILTLIYRGHEHRKIKKGKIHPDDKTEFHLTGILVLLLLIFGFLWYTQVTDTADGLINFSKESFSNLGNMFSEDVQMQGQSPLEQFNIFNKQINYNDVLKDYTEEVTTKYNQTNSYDTSKYANYRATLRASKSIPYKIDSNIILIISYLKEFLKILIGKIFIIMGVVFLFFLLKKDKIHLQYLTIILACFFVLFLMIILPFTTISYDLARTYQQILIILSIPAVFGVLLIFKFIKEKKKILLVTFMLIIYFLFLSGFIGQFTGGLDTSMRLNNFGGEYNHFFSHNSEIFSGTWLKNNNNSNVKVYVDNRGDTKLFLSTNQLRLIKDVLPSIIEDKSYVYSSYANTKEQITFKSFRGNILPFNFPTEFLNENKNKIYANGGSEVFK